MNINDLESIVELVIEQIIGIEDAFEEFEDEDEPTTQLNLKFDFFSQSNNLFHLSNEVLIFKRLLFQDQNYNPFDGFYFLYSPPPKANEYKFKQSLDRLKQIVLFLQNFIL